MNGTAAASMTTAFGRRMPVEIVEFDGPLAAIITAGGTRATVKRTSLGAAEDADPTYHRSVAVTPRSPVTEPGMYRQGTDMYKVQRARESGSLYAKRLVQIGGQRLTDDGDRVKFEFEYAPGALRSLSADDRLSLDEARAFGIQYGVCCVCGAWLKDADSVAAGIGPVCAGRL